MKPFGIWLRSLCIAVEFYLHAAEFANRMRSLGKSTCFPAIEPIRMEALSVSGLVHPGLVFDASGSVVSNDIQMEHGGELCVLTGSNQGGKTTFLQSVGICQVLFQLGWCVPASSARLSPVNSITAWFAQSGKAGQSTIPLDQEFMQITALVKGLPQYSLVLLNEPFSRLRAASGVRLSLEVLCAMAVKHARGVFVTHLFPVAQHLDQLNAILSPCSRISSLVVSVRHNGEYYEPTYQILRKPPDGSSYAWDVLARKGLIRRQAHGETTESDTIG